MMGNEKLLPCPFCGGEATVFELNGGSGYIDCCFCWLGPAVRMSWKLNGAGKEDAIAAWNRRTPEVVRCRECRRGKQNDFGVIVCNLDNLVARHKDDFCSYGEREDGTE